MKPQLMSLLMGGITLLAVPAGAADETINCTATPNCADLGYTKNADSCPDGGIKCPFDENKMFCLRSADLGFQIKNDVKAGQKVNVGITFEGGQNVQPGKTITIDLPQNTTNLAGLQEQSISTEHITVKL